LFDPWKVCEWRSSVLTEADSKTVYFKLFLVRRMAAIHQQFRSSGSGGDRPLPAPPSSPRWSGVNLGGGQNENGEPGAQEQAEGAPENVLMAPSESA